MSEEIQATLLKAQQAIAKQDYDAAINAFTKLIDGAKLPNPTIPLLSRSTCYMQMKKYTEAIKDAEAAFRLEDVHTSDELLPGCYSSRTAAAARLASAYGLMGDKAKSETYKKLTTELMKKGAKNIEEAIALKEEGNELFKAGKVAEALSKWTKGIKLDPTNTGILSNSALALTKMGKLDEAMQMADRCIAANPSWSKGWYRKGVIFMRLNRFADAVAAFQGGLECSPDDEDLKRSYMEASKAAEKSGARRQETGFDKRMIGMMMDLRHNAFDVRAFMSKSKIRSQLEYWDLKLAPLLSTAPIQEFFERTMRLIYPNFRKGMLPVGENPLLSKKSPTWANYILPDHPLLTCLLFLRLFKTSFGLKSNWHVIWSHSIPSKPFLKSSLYPHVSTHATYAAIVSKTTGEVVDILSLWAREVGGDSTEDGTRWLDRLTVDVDEDADVAEKLKSSVYYTCDDEAKVGEYLEYYYKSLDARGGSRPSSFGKAKPARPTPRSTPGGVKGLKVSDPIEMEEGDEPVEEPGLETSEAEDLKPSPVQSPQKAQSIVWRFFQEVGVGLAVVAALFAYFFASGLVEVKDVLKLLELPFKADKKNGSHGEL
ncbi:hypothetical protein HDU67_008113 [Dinochytrium kinnereticum]|nr:hypothetical protein HDU67_008113 [Dinochytrium kinnereticum]